MLKLNHSTSARLGTTHPPHRTIRRSLLPHRRWYTAQLESETSRTVNRKKGLLRTLVLPTTLFGGVFYGAGIYGSSRNDKIRDFFMDQVPFGERLLNFFEESNLEHLAEVSKGAVEVVGRTIQQAKSIAGVDHPTPSSSSSDPQHRNPSANSTAVEKIKEKTEAAVQRAKQVPQNLSGSVTSTHQKPPPSIQSDPTPAGLPLASSHQVQSAQKSDPAGLPTYNREIPIGHEPPPGFIGSAPRPRDPSTEPLPSPPPLPLLAPIVKDLSSSEPILGQLASSIDSLAGFLRDHPEVVVRGKDPSGKDAPRVLSSATEDLKNLARRLEEIKSEEQAQLRTKLETQAKEYGKVLLDAERELHQRLDQQEENWKMTFDQERSQLAKSFEQKLAKELETQQALINERLEQEVISQGLEMQRRWMREIKSQVELEREGRWSKLAELEGCMKQLGRVTLENEEYLEDNLRLNQLWNALRAISAAAFQSSTKSTLDHETRALHRINERSRKLRSIHDGEQSEDQALESDPDVISAALESIPRPAIESGVESLPSLTLWFKESVHPKIRSASLLPPRAGLVSYLSSTILSSLLFTNVSSSSSSLTSNPSQDPISVLDRVNGLLDRKELELAVRELNSLSGWPKVLASDWLQAARKHLELQQAIQVIETEATLQSLLL